MRMSLIKITKTGIAEYPYLTTPDYQFSSEGKYQVKLVIPAKEAQEDIDLINNVIASRIAKDCKDKFSEQITRAPLPYEIIGDFVRFKFQCKASGINSKTKQPFSQKPVIKDAKDHLFPEDKQIWSGSKLRIAYEPVAYNVSGTGIGATLRLKGAQVVELVEGSGITFGEIEDNQSEYQRLPVDEHINNTFSECNPRKKEEVN